jgi:hypothetical protein
MLSSLVPHARWALVIAALGAVPARGTAQQQHRCTVLCMPTIALLPSMIRTHLFGGPTVETMSTGARHRLPPSTNMEMIIVASANTAVPRLSAFTTVQWLPNASEARNPFTLYTANDLGEPVHANAATVTLGLSGSVFTAPQTHGVLDLNLNAGDLFSQAARPGDDRAYTYKLDLDLVTHWHAFARTGANAFLHRVTVVGIFDYVATGLPRAGDEVPKGRLFMSDARPAALIVGLSLPITPEVK